MLDRLFLDFSVRTLRQLTGRIHECVMRLDDEQLWARASADQNAAGNLLLHLAGNVRQWIISGVGGKPDVRVRDREFSARGPISREDLLERLEGTVEEAAAVLEKVPAARLAERVTIQKYEMSLLEAIYHVVEHYSQHTGQIILLTRLITGEQLGFYKHLDRRGTQRRLPEWPQPIVGQLLELRRVSARLARAA